jgi:hypothetical protein
MEGEIAKALSDGTHSALQDCITNLKGYIAVLLTECDSDTVQDCFESDMTDAGYFDDLGVVDNLTREQCIGILDDADIYYNMDESLDVLRQAIESHLADGTLGYPEVENA